MDQTGSIKQEYGSILKKFGKQVGQLASNLSRRPWGGLPSNIEKNPREKVNAVTLRSGKELEKVEKEPRKVVDKGKKVVEDTPKEDDTNSSKPAPDRKSTRLNSSHRP